MIACIAFLPVCATAGEFRGLTEPHRVLKIGSPSEGVIESVDVDRGDVVRKGQVIARLQSGVEKATMELAKARAEMEGTIKGKQASKELFLGKKTRVEQLHKKELASPSEMEEAVANWQVSEMQLKESLENKQLAELEYKRAAEVLKRLTIVSPVNGVVVERFLSAGEYVREQPVVKIAELDPLNVEVVVPASEFNTIKVGMKATVIAEPPLKGTYTATVRVVDRVIDGASGTFGVRLQMPNPRFRLLAGLKCRVIFPDQKQDKATEKDH
jgi:RND family efflux transporter MFP subunit